VRRVANCYIRVTLLLTTTTLFYGDVAGNTVEENSSAFSLIRIASCLQCFDAVGLGVRKGIRPAKNMGGWWRWALLSLDGVAPSRMVSVSASVNLPLHHKV